MTELQKLVHCRESLIDLVAYRRDRSDNDANTKWFIDNADAMIAEIEKREQELATAADTEEHPAIRLSELNHD